MAGRPRDPEVERKIHAAACDLYGRAGWTGFSIESVARDAGVGKTAIYLRWSAKADLLTDSLASLLLEPAGVDTGSLRGDLIELARHYLRLYVGDHAGAMLRLTFEGPLTAELTAAHTSLRDSQVLATRAIVRRGIRRGDLRADAPVTLLLDTLFGGLLMHAITTPGYHAMELAAQVDSHADALVDFVLGSIASKETND